MPTPTTRRRPRPSRRRPTRPVVAAIVLAVVAVAGCGGDGRADGDEGTVSTSSPAPDPTPTSTTVEGSDGEGAGSDGDGAAPATAECTATSVETTPDLVYRELAGVDPSALSLDLSVPDLPERCPDPPVLVWVHGGAFRTGDKANHVEDKVRLAAENGWAFASVNYRLTTADETSDPVRHPDHADDVAAAVAWLRDEGTAHGVDGTRLALVGHSAGGFLVSVVGTDDDLLAATGGGLDDLACVVSDDTSYDIPAAIEQGGAQADMFRGAFGDDPQVWSDASPMVTAAAGGAPPFLVITRGTQPRRAESEAFAQILRDAGGTAEVLDARPLSHADVNRLIGTEGDDVVTPVLVDFLTDCLAPT